MAASDARRSPLRFNHTFLKMKRAWLADSHLPVVIIEDDGRVGNLCILRFSSWTLRLEHLAVSQQNARTARIERVSNKYPIAVMTINVPSLQLSFRWRPPAKRAEVAAWHGCAPCQCT